MKTLLFSLLLLAGTLFAQVQPVDWQHSKGGYLGTGADSVVIVSPDYFEYNYITVTDTSDSTPDSITVYVADLFYGDYTQVKLKSVTTWSDSVYAVADSATHNKYLILHPFAESIKLVKPNTGSGIKWSFEGR